MKFTEKLGLKFFSKNIWSIGKKVVLLHPLRKRRLTIETRKNFSKNIWSIGKKVIPLHPQTKRLSSLRNIDNTAQKDLD